VQKKVCQNQNISEGTYNAVIAHYTQKVANIACDELLDNQNEIKVSNLRTYKRISSCADRSDKENR